jgi:23S rRNA (cytosine1962-C5)-methyltransferase
LARDNANLNQVRVRYVHADVYPYLRQMIANGRTFDVVVLDPPKLIATREELSEGRQRYLDMNKLALQVVRCGGVLLTCSCSGLLSPEAFLDVIRQAARITARRPVVFNTSGAAGDHPIALDCPETSYLKAVWLRVL